MNIQIKLYTGNSSFFTLLPTGEKVKITNKNRCHYKRTQYGWQEKTSYSSILEANKHCTFINKHHKAEFKCIPFCCNICNKIHIGKDKTVLNDYYKNMINNISLYSL